MEKGVQIPVVKVPMLDVGFLNNVDLGWYTHALSQFKRKDISSLDVLDEKTFKGSNSFIPVFLNQYKGILPEGESVATMAEFTRAFNIETQRVLTGGIKDFEHFFYNAYQDTGIILRTNGDSHEANDYLAKNLFRKLDARGFRATPESPVVLSLTDLRLRRNSKSDYGLVFDLTEKAEPIQGENVEQAYGSRAEIDRFTVYDAQGIPVPDKKGKFKIWNRDNGVSRVYSSSSQNANAYCDDLAYSTDIGRVVIGSLEESV